jgi:hypothetical protein
LTDIRKLVVPLWQEFASGNILAPALVIWEINTSSQMCY